jgi:thiamine pyrophosphate-dependent acetolactate synthase large subunit-like protein
MQVPQGLANPEKEVLCYYGDRAFSMTAIDMDIAVVGNNSAMNQIRYGQLAKYGQESGNVGDLLSDLPFGKLAEMLGGYGEEVHDPALIRGAAMRSRICGEARACLPSSTSGSIRLCTRPPRCADHYK